MQAALNNAQRRAEQTERERNGIRKVEATLRSEMEVMRRSLGQADVVRISSLCSRQCSAAAWQAPWLDVACSFCLPGVQTAIEALPTTGDDTCCCGVLQKATQDARALSSMTRERDRLLQELAACSQRLAAADTRASEQDACTAQNAEQILRVGVEEQAHRCLCYKGHCTIESCSFFKCMWRQWALSFSACSE
jgi:hypothetical protein